MGARTGADPGGRRANPVTYSHQPTGLAGTDPKTDREVLHDGQGIGRVRLDARFPGGPRWQWSCRFDDAVPTTDHTGFTDTMADALEQVRVRYERRVVR